MLMSRLGIISRITRLNAASCLSLVMILPLKLCDLEQTLTQPHQRLQERRQLPLSQYDYLHRKIPQEIMIKFLKVQLLRKMRTLHLK